MSNIIPFKKVEPTDPKCSFCARPKAETKHLFQSGFNSHHICDQCLVQAKRRCDETVIEPKAESEVTDD